MKHNEVIDWKVNSLINKSTDVMPDDMCDYLNKHTELAEELTFIERFWQSDIKDSVTPSAQMDANFYQMLSKAQAAQIDSNEVDVKVEQATTVIKTNNISDIKKEKNNSSVSLISHILTWLVTPQAIGQFAMLSLVFVIGFNVNQQPFEQTPEQGLAKLQQEVSSLNTMLALTLMDKSSASERLSGVAYSRSSDLNNPILQERLISLIQNDKSTSVRLAVIKRLNDLSSIEDYSDALFQIITNENSVLVQLAACRLILNKGSDVVQRQLKELLLNENINPELRDVLQTHAARSFT